MKKKMIMKNELLLVLLHIFVLLLPLGFTMNPEDGTQQRVQPPELPFKSAANSNERPSGHVPGHPSDHAPGHPSGNVPGRPSDHAPGRPSEHAPGHPSDHAPGRPSDHAPGQPSGHAPGQPSGHVPGRPSGHVPGRPSGHTPGQPSSHVPGRPSDHTPGRPSEDKHDPHGPSPPTTVQPNSLVDLECLEEKYTRSSCAKMFCPPWQRCIEGKCLCKLPYQCPRVGSGVCGANKKPYFSLCQAQAIACRDKKVIFSHFGSCQDPLFDVQLQKSDTGDVVVVSKHEELLICGTKSWNMAAANVACSQKDNRGAAKALNITLRDLGSRPQESWPTKCMSVSCTGSERSLAECVHYKPQKVKDTTSIAAVTCYTERQGERCNEFTCVNTKCISWKQTCDGVDDCGDNSDEMCCRGCTEGAFHCKSGVCISPDAVQDDIRDCLGGDDEIQSGPDLESAHTDADDGKAKDRDVIVSNPKEEIQMARAHIESQLHCGIPNMDYLNKTEEETKHKRTKRVVGGQEALPTQIQWQVAVEEDGAIHCGGAYLGGCWVLTAAHCVRPKPKAFRIKFSIWKKFSLIGTSDKVQVKNIIIHSQYNSRTYENDIALIQLQELANERECLHPNPAVRPVCVPWSPKQFLPSDTCTISGWGRNKAGESINTLKWANVTLIGNCKSYYKDRYYSGMECAGDLEGKVDSCQGDSGGPLVCKDAAGVSYVWGIVSWGDKCGEPGFPGVYTKVAHYFEWIRLHTGWPAVTRFNQ